MLPINIKKLHKDAIIPTYAHNGDAGADLYSIEDTSIEPNQQKLFRTGLAMEVPNGHTGFIWDKSGLAAKHSIHCLAGVIDSDYRGEIGVVLINLGKDKYEVKKGQKIAQIVFQPVYQAKFHTVDSLEETIRSIDGFGSTEHKI